MSASDIFRKIRDFLVSLKLTVVLLVLSMLLVFFATLDQVNLGIWAVQQKWFHSFFVYGTLSNGVSIPLFPGGYLVGSLLFLNLVAGHIYRFRLPVKKIRLLLAQPATDDRAGEIGQLILDSLKKFFLLITHLGLLMLLVGIFFAGIWQEDYSVILNQGQTATYAESFNRNELAIIDTTAPDRDIVTTIPEGLLARGGSIQHRSLPFRVTIRAYYPNSALQMRDQTATAASSAFAPPLADVGVGAQVAIVPLDITNRSGEKNVPSAYLSLTGADGAPLGTWLVSTDLDPQTFTYQGKTWSLALRPQRRYFDFSLQLLKVTSDFYLGSDIPKNYASRVLLRDANDPNGREVVIYMNNPLRHAGLTFYQSNVRNPAFSFDSGFQVVSNPVSKLPYIACLLTGLGLLFYFLISLAGFVSTRKSKNLKAEA